MAVWRRCRRLTVKREESKCVSGDEKPRDKSQERLKSEVARSTSDGLVVEGLHKY